MHKILIVDDDKDMVEVYLRALERAGYHCKYAYNGKDALAELKVMDGADLIILDLQMPKMSGEEFLRVLRSEAEYEKFKATKVLVVSATLYEYKDMVSAVDKIIDRMMGNFIDYPKMQVGLSKKAKKIKELAQAGDTTRITEKLKRNIYSLTTDCPENDIKLNRRISVNLVEKVKEILSEA